MKFGTRVCLKPFNGRGEFELDRARSINNIAENLPTLGNEMDKSKFAKHFIQQEGVKNTISFVFNTMQGLKHIFQNHLLQANRCFLNLIECQASANGLP